MSILCCVMVAAALTQIEKRVGVAVNYEQAPRHAAESPDLPLPMPAAPGLAPMLDALVAASKSQYQVKSINGLYFVIPADAADRPLDTPVSFWYQERSVGETIDLILSGVSQGGRTKVLGNGPPMMMITSKVTLGATNEPARNVLAKLLLQLGPRIGYQLLCDPSFHGCFLNVHVVP